MNASLRFVASIAALVAAAVPFAALAQSSPEYHIVKTVPLGAPNRWDYVVF